MNATSIARCLVVMPVLCALLVATTGTTVFAQSAAKGASGLPLPRFVSLKAQRVNLRIGPSKDYAVEWQYTRSGLPMEIIQEYDHWRRVRDPDGTEGWIHKSLLTGDRTAVVAPWKRGEKGVFVTLRERPLLSADTIAMMEPGVVVRIDECNGKWCRGEVQGAEGWVAQDEIWGVYPGEAFR
jgi:SH3-like domain-containing protein